MILAELPLPERRLLRAASWECRLHWRRAPIQDIASIVGMSQARLGSVLRRWVERGWWDYSVKLEAGYVTRAGVAAALERTQAMQQQRAA